MTGYATLRSSWIVVALSASGCQHAETNAAGSPDCILPPPEAGAVSLEVYKRVLAAEPGEHESMTMLARALAKGSETEATCVESAAHWQAACPELAEPIANACRDRFPDGVRIQSGRLPENQP